MPYKGDSMLAEDIGESDEVKQKVEAYGMAV